MPIDPEDVVLVVSPTNEADSYVVIPSVRSQSGTHGLEDFTKVKVLARADPYIKEGIDTDTYSLTALFEKGTDGQKTLRDAKKNRTDVYIGFLTDDTPGAEEGFTQKCRVTEYTEDTDADAPFVEASFTLESNGPLVELTVGLP